MFKTEILSEKQKKLFHTFTETDWLSAYYLAGGTALALYFGHRKSDDFDFFINGKLNNTEIKNNLSHTFKYQILSEDKNTLYVSIDEIRVSFIGYEYDLLEKTNSEKFLSVAGLKDIACMKLSSISSRGSKKDFFDPFYILKKINLDELIELFKIKFGKDFLNKYQILKSLLYFEDADKEPDLILTEKEYIQRWVI